MGLPVYIVNRVGMLKTADDLFTFGLFLSASVEIASADSAVIRTNICKGEDGFFPEASSSSLGVSGPAVGADLIRAMGSLLL